MKSSSEEGGAVKYSAHWVCGGHHRAQVTICTIDTAYVSLCKLFQNLYSQQNSAFNMVFPLPTWRSVFASGVQGVHRADELQSPGGVGQLPGGLLATPYRLLATPYLLPISS